jgi:ribose 5-phosphate isomerase B
MKNPTIILASDHAGFALKEAVKSFLQKDLKDRKYAVIDVGAHELIPEDDYPTFMAAAAVKVAQDIEGNTKAIIFGASGQGEAIVANRFPGVRAVVWYGGDQAVLKHTRNDNDANVLSIGAKYVEEDAACDAVEVWLDTPFSREERHERRIKQIDSIE